MRERVCCFLYVSFIKIKSINESRKIVKINILQENYK